MRVSVSQTNKQNATLATRQDIDGVPHLVIPTIALVPGVLNGVLYREADMKAFAATWNGIPTPIKHPPEDKDGFSTANTIECEETVNVGRFYDAKWEDGKLKGNIYLNIEKAEEKGFGDIVANFEAGKMMEVSTSMSFEANNNSGTLDGKDYNAIALGIRPDHLALLPDEKGACSIEGGCGAMRLNDQEGEQPMKKDQTGASNCDACDETAKVQGLRNKLFDAAKELGVKFGFLTNETAHGDIRQQLQLQLDGMRTDKDAPWAWIEDVFNDSFIYSKDGKLMRMSYIVVDEVVKMVGDAVEVIRDTEYKTKPSGGGGDAAPALNVNNKGNTPMKKDAMIKALIASDSSAMTADNQDIMEAMDDTVLADMVKMAADMDKMKSEMDEMKSAGAKNTLSDEDNALFATLRDRENARVAQLRTDVLAANAHLSEEIVAGFSLPALEAMASNIKLSTDMGAAAGGTSAAKNADGSDYVKPAVFLAASNGNKTNEGGAV